MAAKTKKEEPNSPRVFVYGTLKSGRANHGALKGCELLGKCMLRGKYQMISLGWYPAIIDLSGTEASERVMYGEVYRISDEVLHTLDLIEGHPHYYVRKKVETPFKKAWAYFLDSAYLEGRPIIENGIWLPTKEELDFMAPALTQIP